MLQGHRRIGQDDVEDAGGRGARWQDGFCVGVDQSEDNVRRSVAIQTYEDSTLKLMNLK